MHISKNAYMMGVVGGVVTLRYFKGLEGIWGIVCSPFNEGIPIF